MPKVGRPSSFKPEYCEQARKLCLLGAKDTQIADFFKTSERTLNTWKIEHPEFLQALKDGRENADAAIAQSLYHRAKGYSHPAVKILQHDGVPITVPYVEHYPPDTVACIFWLKNRQPDRWRDKHEVTGQDGAPLLDNKLLLAAMEVAKRSQSIDVQTVAPKQIVDASVKKEE